MDQYRHITLLKSSPGFDAAHYASMKAEVARVSAMMDVLETFNGQTFLDFPDAGGVRMGDGAVLRMTGYREAANDLEWREVRSGPPHSISIMR